MDLQQYIPFGTEGSGNQKKFWVDNILIKLDSNRYKEATKEYSASCLGNLFGLPVVQYRVGKYMYNGKLHNGCECVSYLNSTDDCITVYDCLGMAGAKITLDMPTKEYFQKLVSSIVFVTGMHYDYVKHYIMQILVFDFIICNPDRHLSNIEIIYNSVSNTYKFAPIYDHGQAFLGRDGIPDTRTLNNALKRFKTYPFNRNPIKNLIDITEAKQICQQFVVNADTFGGIDSLQINTYHKQLVKKRIDTLLNL